ncbi:hypothetical protein ALC62_00281 [Cyphomyrmex costatus]|uniref:Uncharacterized protein n=1 Tax=Cyphomyrmex costatus TaxID=456900 RepID=A0A195D6W3_9HYME|nr:hypothetical protein ALC62_00281 [Cyphomyrmex costatus]
MDSSLIARFSILISQSASAKSSSASIRPICYGSTTINEDVGDDNEPLLLKSALNGAYERMRLRGGLPPHINVASLHRLLMPGSGVPPPYRRFGWSTGSSRHYHHRRRRYSRRCRHSAAGIAIDEDDHEGIPCLTADTFVSRIGFSHYADDNKKLQNRTFDIVEVIGFSPCRLI